jgi:hypothetical protein
MQINRKDKRIDGSNFIGPGDGSSSPAKAGDPVLQSALVTNREAALDTSLSRDMTARFGAS